ncbi:MAG TPA: arginase family protein [Methylocella sp.]|nr:arginase family protein [Methylocella sp.]
MKFALLTFTHTLETDRGTAAGPRALLEAGLAGLLRLQGHEVDGPFEAALAPEEQMAYGAWHRIGLANAHLARLVTASMEIKTFPLILESNCYAAPGVLAGLQRSRRTPRLGMVWIDAHADCNTPETTLSGMLSGMPVAMSLGFCLERLRKKAGLDPPMAARDVVMVCVRANDPLEQDLVEASGIETVPVADVKGERRLLRAAMERLSQTTDLIYVHLDIDALDESEFGSMWLTASDGPTSLELAAALNLLMAYPKIAALGVSDLNPEKDANGRMVRASLAVIEGGIAGLDHEDFGSNRSKIMNRDQWS